jgi:hypothetical protein
MTTSTRESMRRELKELAKMAETMGKPSPDAALAEEASSMQFPASALERPVTPASASRVSVPPMATPTAPPVFDYAEPRRTGKRAGVIAVLIGAGLAAALIGGAAVGKSLAGNSTASTPPVDVRGAAATMAPPPVAAAAAEPPVAAPAPQPAPEPVAAAVVVPAKAMPTTPVAAPVHKHAAPKPAAAPPAAAAPKAAVAANPPSSGGDAVAAPKAAASPGLAKPAPAKAAAGGGTDSLEDLIRKEVAAQKK